MSIYKFIHPSNDLIETVSRYPTRREVEEANHSRLNQIQSVSKVYEAQDTAARDKNGNPKLTFEQMTRLLERLVAPKTITLKVSWNMSDSFVYGCSIHVSRSERKS